jgi:hypothetical protein
MIISARESSGNAKKTIPIVFIEPKTRVISAPDKPTFLQACKALDGAGIELFIEGQKIRNIAPERIPDDPDEGEE